MIRDSKQLQIGKAGEYLVCANLILKGFVAFPSEQGLPYDVLLDNGSKLLKVQVKTTEKPRLISQERINPIPVYSFSIKRAGKDGKTRYGLNEIDLFALVCLDTMQIGYITNKEMPTTINIRVDNLRGSYHDEKGVKDYEMCLKEYKTDKNKSNIARKLNLAKAVVSKYLQPKYKPFKTGARYFSDFIRDPSWFLKL